MIGREIDARVLTAAAEVEPWRLAVALKEAFAKGILVRADTPSRLHRFARRVVRQTLYDDLDTETRCALHGRVGRAIETVHARSLDSHLECLAHHFLRAGPETVDRAIDYGVRAGQRSLELLPYEDAARRHQGMLGMLERKGRRNDHRCAELQLALAKTVGAARHLGLLSFRMGRLEEAAKHFEEALASSASLGAPLWIAQVQADYAGMLVCRAGPGDAARACHLLNAAFDTADGLGLRNFVERVDALRGRALELRRQAAAARPAEAMVSGDVFRREGDVWEVAFEGKSVRIRDALGLRYLAQLLRHPGEEFHVADLVALAGGRSGAAAGTVGDAGEMLDARARNEYRRRLEELRYDLERARSWGDGGWIERIERETELVTAELTRAVGLGGRATKTADVAQRARKAVGNRIRATIVWIETEHPPLGRHLRKTVRTGLFCAYAPARGVAWTV